MSIAQLFDTQMHTLVQPVCSFSTRIELWECHPISVFCCCCVVVVEDDDGLAVVPATIGIKSLFPFSSVQYLFASKLMASLALNLSVVVVVVVVEDDVVVVVVGIIVVFSNVFAVVVIIVKGREGSLQCLYLFCERMCHLES